MLTGCAASQYMGVMQDMDHTQAAVDHEGNKANGLSSMGQPQKRTPIREKVAPFHVGFNRQGEIVGSGYTRTCAEAAQQGYLSSDLTMAEQYRRSQQKK